MNKQTLAAGFLTAAVALGSHAAVQTQGRNGLTMTALTADQALVTYTVRTPATTPNGAPRAIVGLSGTDTRLLGIDYRPLDGQLYGLGDGGGLYTVDPATGIATLVATLVGMNGAVVPTGSRFDLDFNPAADALRVVSDAGQNLRILPSARMVGQELRPIGFTFEDSTVSYAPLGAVPRDAATGITAAAYTNNDNSAVTGTQLFTVDVDLDALNLQNPPNEGTQSAIGPLGVDAIGDAGFDIVSGLDEMGVAISNAAFAVLGTPNGGTLYSVDLTTGAATRVSQLAAGNRVVDIAFPTGQ